jgi:ribosomal protein L37AE/L43A
MDNLKPNYKHIKLKKMATYRECKNCGNSEEGDNIYKCSKCNVIYCESCGDFSLNVFGNNNWICPSCHSTSDSDCLGQIEADGDDDDDD